MKCLSSRNRVAGFSLIEVLIAVVVLAFGLLALAALQTRLIQSSSDAKAQSAGLALAKDKLEEMRSYTSLTGYAALNTGSDSVVDTAGSLGGVNYSRAWTVKRYALATGATAFTQLAAGNVTGNLPSGYITNNEFKTIDVRVTWADATGQSRTVAMEDAIASLDPADTAKELRNSGGRSRGPKVVITDPSTDPGVIPIAISSTASTAATNPKPVNIARTGDDAVETRFDVLTYAALSGGLATAQSKVETSVVGCTCTKASTATPVYRPVYWNGSRYVAPQLASYTAPAIAKSGVTQSRYCTVCCATHHDPVGVADPKFSPRRSAHDHYRVVSGAFVIATTGDYLESCRLIRTDGIFDVAADLSDDYFNLLATGSQGDSPAPSITNPPAVANYKNFVFDYLTARYVTPSPDTSTASATFNNRTSPAPATNAAANDLDNPTRLDITNSPTALKWLHARGLYVDYLEQPALDAIADAKANCTGTSGAAPTSAQLRDCVLRVLPFTSINLTELAVWTPLTGPQIKVTNDDFDTTILFTDPIRGKVTTGTLPTNNTVTNAVATASAGNSGVAIAGDIDPDDTASTQTDAQPMRIQGSAGPLPGSTFKFQTANFTISPSNPRSLGFIYGAAPLVTCGVSGTTNPVVCTTSSGQPLPASITVAVGNYNTTGSDTVINVCRSGTTPMPYRAVYDVTGFTSSNALASISPITGTVFNNNLVGIIPTGEYTQATVSLVNPSTPAAAPTTFDTITATMSAPAYRCPANYPGSGQSAACAGSGANAAPTWSTTYVACPSSAGSPPNFP